MNKKATALCHELMETIQNSQSTYGETISALKWLLVVYQNKGNNLLDGVSIQEVEKYAQRREKALVTYKGRTIVPCQQNPDQ